jgi:hypothetical protein
VRVEHLGNGFTKAILEWSDRPDRDEAWFERESRSNPEFAREYGLLWGSVVGTPVFSPLYRKSIHETRMEPLKGVAVHRGWDFGYVHPACVWAQFDGTGQLGVRHELLGEDETIEHFGRRVVDLSDTWFGEAEFVDYGDPAGHQRNDKSERTSIQILKDLFGIRVRTRPSEIIQGIDRIRSALAPRDDGRPGLTVDPIGAEQIAYGFARSYIRDEHDPEKPFKDGHYDHLFDALRYMAIHVLKTPKRKREAPKVRTREQLESAAIREHLGRKPNRAHPVLGNY